MCMGAPHASVMKSTPVNDESRYRILCDGGHTTSVRNLDGRGHEHRRRYVRFHRAGGAPAAPRPRPYCSSRASAIVASMRRGSNAVRGMELAASLGGSHVILLSRTGQLADMGSPARGDARDRVHAIVLVGGVS